MGCLRCFFYFPNGTSTIWGIDQVNIFLFFGNLLSKSKLIDYLVGGLEHGWIMTFHSVGNVIIPTDELIFFRGVGIPPTSYTFISYRSILDGSKLPQNCLLVWDFHQLRISILQGIQFNWPRFTVVLSHRPWQVKIRFRYKWLIFRVYVNLPAGNVETQCHKPTIWGVCSTH